MPIGFQSWSVQQLLQKDFDGTLKQVAGYGFQSMELCSPPSYRQFGFGGLVNLKGSELRAKINNAGLICESCHYQWGKSKTSLDERIAYARELGLKRMILSTFGLQPKATLDDWKKNAEEMNKMGERATAAGIQLGFHNHDFEFKEIGGVLIYDELAGKKVLDAACGGGILAEAMAGAGATVSGIDLSENSPQGRQAAPLRDPPRRAL